MITIFTHCFFGSISGVFIGFDGVRGAVDDEKMVEGVGWRFWYVFGNMFPKETEEQNQYLHHKSDRVND